MFSLLQMSFCVGLFAWLGRFELEHPGAVRGLVFGVQGLIVGGARLPHFPKDFQPALTQAAQSAGVRLSLFAVSDVIGLSPGTLGATQIGPEMDRRTQGMRAAAAQFGFTDLPALEGNRRGSPVGLQRLGAGKPLALRADFREQARPELGPRSRQGAEESAIGMLVEELLDPTPILLQLFLERAQQSCATLRQQTLGGDLCCRTAKLGRPIKEGEASFPRLRPPESMRMQPLLPFTLACFLQGGRSREAQDKAPGRHLRPIAKGLKRRWKVFAYRALKLIDERRTLLD